MMQVPSDSSRWFVVERLGTVRVFDNKQDVKAYSDFVDITPRVDSRVAPNAACSGWRFTPISPRPRACT